MRPVGAVLLSLAVWLLCAALVLQAVAVSGPSGLLLLPGPLLVCAVIWAVLWAPRVVVHVDGLEVRNILRSHRIPFAAVEDVRLGAMLRIVLRTVQSQDASHPVDVVIAWNAPGAGRDRHRDRLARIRQADRAPGATRPRADWGERLRADQSASPSSVVVEAWEKWQTGGVPGGERADPDTRWNTAVILVLVVCAMLVGLRAAL